MFIGAKRPEALKRGNYYAGSARTGRVFTFSLVVEADSVLFGLFSVLRHVSSFYERAPRSFECRFA